MAVAVVEAVAEAVAVVVVVAIVVVEQVRTIAASSAWKRVGIKNYVVSST